MTLPLQRSRETVEVDVDLDRNPECDWRHCSGQAAWIGVTSCGCQSALHCEPHKLQMEDLVLVRPTCGRCKGDVTPVVWRRL